jgi:hypothetical protein
MSDDTLNSENDETSPKALRDALEKANKQLAEYKKLAEEAAAEKRRESLTSILKAKGLKESAASHYTGDVSEESVVKWATDLGLLSTDTSGEDLNAEAARRASAASEGSQSLMGATATKDGKTVGDPHKILELMNTPGFSYEDGVRLGIFPKDPNVI